MSTIRLEIPNSKGQMLKAELELPNNKKPDHYAIFAHCFACNRNSEATNNITRALANKGFGVLRFDFTGLGMNDHSEDGTGFGANINDLIDAYNYMKEHYSAPSLLVGHSLGGTAAIVAGSKLEGVKAIATIGAPSSTTDVKDQFAALNEEENAQGFTVSDDIANQYSREDVLDIVKNMRKKALLIMHSPVDRTVSPDHAHHLFVAAFHPKSFVALDGADHLLSKSEDSNYAGDVIGSWASRFMPVVEKEELTLESEQLVAHLNPMRDKFTTSIQMSKHALVADEPEEVGGNNFGPSPYELLLSSLASCTAMTLRLYAKRKNWPLEEVFVYSSHAKKHVEDIDSSNSSRIDLIDKRLVLVGDLTQEQQTRLLEIAENCPVHRTLQQDVRIETILSSGSDFYQ